MQNFSQALHSYRQAAAKGNPDAHSMIAVMFEKGQGVEKNLKKAEEWYGKAAKLNGHDQPRSILPNGSRMVMVSQS